MFASFYNNEEFSDYVFVGKQQQRLPAHRVILSTKSSFFSILFKNSFPEKQKTYMLENFEVQSVFIKFFYTGTLDVYAFKHNTQNVLDFLAWFDMFEIPINKAEAMDSFCFITIMQTDVMCLPTLYNHCENTRHQSVLDTWMKDQNPNILGPLYQWNVLKTVLGNKHIHIWNSLDSQKKKIYLDQLPGINQKIQALRFFLDHNNDDQIFPPEIKYCMFHYYARLCIKLGTSTPKRRYNVCSLLSLETYFPFKGIFYENLGTIFGTAPKHNAIFMKPSRLISDFVNVELFFNKDYHKIKEVQLYGKKVAQMFPHNKYSIALQEPIPIPFKNSNIIVYQVFRFS